MISEYLTDDFTHQEFWNECHRTNNQYYLTGSCGSDVWKNLRTDDRVGAGVRVLNIGVGLGHCTKALVEMGCRVHVLDISPVALGRVSSIVERTWTPDQFDEMPTSFYDLVLSHLVTQHMPLVELVRQVGYVVKSLSSEGMFAMQFSSWLPGVSIELTAATTKGGGACYTQEEMRGVIAQCGGHVTKMEKIYEFPKHRSSWSVVHMVR